MKQKAVIHDHAAASMAEVERAALDRGIKADIGLRDTELECAKYRRVMALEAELDAWQLKCGKERDKSERLQNELRKAETLAQACSKDLQVMSASWKAVSVERDNLERDLSQREQHLKSCENALIEAHGKLEYMKLLAGEDGRKLQDYQAQISKQDAWIEQEDGARNILQSNLRDANAEIKRLTALSQTHAASWKAACVRSEYLQKQLDHGQAQFASLQVAYNQQVDDEREMLAQIDTLFVERENAETLHDQQVMRLRAYVWILIAALALVVVSGLVGWGGV